MNVEDEENKNMIEKRGKNGKRRWKKHKSNFIVKVHGCYVEILLILTFTILWNMYWQSVMECDGRYAGTVQGKEPRCCVLACGARQANFKTLCREKRYQRIASQTVCRLPAPSHPPHARVVRVCSLAVCYNNIFWLQIFTRKVDLFSPALPLWLSDFLSSFCVCSLTGIGRGSAKKKKMFKF